MSDSPRFRRDLREGSRIGVRASSAPGINGAGLLLLDHPRPQPFRSRSMGKKAKPRIKRVNFWNY